MNNDADSKRWCLARSLARWGVALLCLGVLGCRDSEERPFKNPEKLSDQNKVYKLRTELAKVTIDGKNYCLRTYNGQFPSPTIEVPQRTEGIDRQIRLDFENKFQKEDSHTGAGMSHDLNVTNLHTHGLHVRPEKTGDGKYQSDNVLLKISPGDPPVEYRFDLDESGPHEAGTYWYHPHVHGSTAIQVANGMAGALIVRGPVDELPGIKEAEERIFVLGQIPYDNDKVKPFKGGECMEETLSINDSTIAATATNTLVNGVLNPTLTTHKNQVERWRFIHAGVKGELTIGLRKSDSDGKCENVDKTNIPMQQIAADGFTYMAKEAVDFVELQPGNRADVMMTAPSEEGTYCVLNLGKAANLREGKQDEPKILAYLKVDAQEGGGTLPSDDDLKGVATEPLPCIDELPTPIRPMIFAQQKDNNKEPEELCEGRTQVAGIGEIPLFNINCKSFSEEAPAVPLPFEKTEEWELSSGFADHPFHIHVNSFTVCKGKINGRTIETPHWMDTLFIRNADTKDSPIRIRTRYEDYKGEFVMHCHYLDHEDNGMMQRLKIQ